MIAVMAVAAQAADVNGSSLKPPAGASVALIVFEDLECPSCAHASPLLEKAAAAHKVPLVIHDIPLKMHPWSWDAAVTARYIEQKYGRAKSDAFRDFIYRNQPQITKGNLRAFAEKWAGQNQVQLPFMLDPQGQIAAAIRADMDLGTQVQMNETPTIFVVSKKGWTQVRDYENQLNSAIEKIKKEAAPVAPVRAGGRSKKK
jgi:protein-disulfide isomerase